MALALIFALPSIIAAIAAVRIRRDIQTPSNRPLGQLAEDTTHVALANYYRLHTLSEGKPPPGGGGDTMPTDTDAGEWATRPRG